MGTARSNHVGSDVKDLSISFRTSKSPKRSISDSFPFRMTGIGQLTKSFPLVTTKAPEIPGSIANTDFAIPVLPVKAIPVLPAKSIPVLPDRAEGHRADVSKHFLA